MQRFVSSYKFSTKKLLFMHKSIFAKVSSIRKSVQSKYFVENRVCLWKSVPVGIFDTITINCCNVQRWLSWAVTVVEATQRLPFQELLHRGVGVGATPFPGFLHFALDPYFIILSAKQGGIKYHFLSLWYDSTWDWTPVSRDIGELSTH